MSAVYNLEPQPTGSVILHTSQGELALELFAKQTPLACRNFLQHCLDGYYDNTVFHRLVPGFVLQGGDPTGSGSGGESIYDGGAFGDKLGPWPMDTRQGANAGPTGVGFRDEFHSRLRYTRRGLVGMANEFPRPDTNGSQFFLTIAAAAELNGKSTLFGRVAGDTIYNLAKMGEAEVVEGTDRPVYPVRLTRVEILVNPFPDMARRAKAAPAAAGSVSTVVVVDRRKRRKGVSKQLLSFGDDEEGEVPVVKRVKKADTRIAAPSNRDDDDDGDDNDSKDRAAEAREKEGGKEEDEEEEEERHQTHQQRVVVHRKGSTRNPAEDRRRKADDDVSDGPPPPPDKPPPTGKSALERTNDEIAALKASMKRSARPEPIRETKKSALEMLIPENAMRGRKRNANGKSPSSTAEDDKRMLSLLASFKSKLAQATESSKPAAAAHKARGEPEASASTTSAEAAGNRGGGGDKKGADEGEEAALCDLHFIADCQSCQAWHERGGEDDGNGGEGGDDEGWMSHALSFATDRRGKDLSMRRKAEEELVMIDPRERPPKEQERAGRAGRAEREARPSGGSGRTWDQARDRARDQARNAHMTRLASLGGRGAK